MICSESRFKQQQTVTSQGTNKLDYAEEYHGVIHIFRAIRGKSVCEIFCLNCVWINM